MTHQVPKDDGFYFAMWLVSDEGTEKLYDATPSRTWDVVELFTDDDDRRRVYLTSVPGSQDAEGFHWHPERLIPPPLKWLSHRSEAADDMLRRFRKMKPEEREEFYQQRIREQRSKP